MVAWIRREKQAKIWLRIPQLLCQNTVPMSEGLELTGKTFSSFQIPRLAMVLAS
jgi:hypothetical protein